MLWFLFPFSVCLTYDTAFGYVRLCLLSAGISFWYNCRVLCTFILDICFRTTGVAFWQHQTVSRSQEQEETAEIITRFACIISRNSYNISGFRVGVCPNDSQPGSTAVLDDNVCSTVSQEQTENSSKSNSVVVKLDATFSTGTSIYGDRGSTVVKVLCYESEGRWFDPRWCNWNFSLT